MIPLLVSCDGQDVSDGGGQTVPAGMVEIQPILPGMFSSIPREAPSSNQAPTRVYEDNDQTNNKLIDNKKLNLPEGSTVWLIARSTDNTSYIRNSYVVYNSDEDEIISYLVPCTVDDKGNVTSMESTPMYLKDGMTYKFSAVSPARKLDDTGDKVSFKARNGEYFYANDCRYGNTTPQEISIKSDNTEAVQRVTLSPMINQTAELKFRIVKGDGVHDLDIQPSGIEVSGLQNDSPDGIDWHMSMGKDDEPIVLKHGGKAGIYNQYNYTIDSDYNVNIEVPIIPMRSISKPVIVVFRLKVNGVPSSFEMMLNEKDFKAGYSYGYRGKVSIREGVEVITWQYVSWETNVEFPFE